METITTIQIKELEQSMNLYYQGFLGDYCFNVLNQMYCALDSVKLGLTQFLTKKQRLEVMNKITGIVEEFMQSQKKKETKDAN